MIFAETIDQVLSGRKSQTLRPAKPGDVLTGGAVVTSGGRIRWRVGGSYSVQPGRGKPGIGRIRCTALREAPNPEAVDDAEARREGFASRDEFLTTWRKLHPRGTGPCWAIGFELEGDR